MIIDAHTHLGNPGGALNARATELIKSMDAAGVDVSAVLAGRLNSINTQQVLEEIEPYKDRMFAVASISPDHEKNLRNFIPEELEYWMEHGIVRGLKFYPGYEPFYPADAWLRPWLEIARKKGLPCIFHAGDTYSHAGGARLKYALPIHIDELAVDMPDLNIIIAHLGYPWQREAAEVMYKNKNVYADCSGFVYGDFTDPQKGDFTKVWEEFAQIAGGIDRVLFGTDWPISNQKPYIELVRKLAGDWAYNIFSGNARKLFQL